MTEKVSKCYRPIEKVCNGTGPGKLKPNLIYILWININGKFLFQKLATQFLKHPVQQGNQLYRFVTKVIKKGQGSTQLGRLSLLNRFLSLP